MAHGANDVAGGDPEGSFRTPWMMTCTPASASNPASNAVRLTLCRAPL